MGRKGYMRGIRNRRREIRVGFRGGRRSRGLSRWRRFIRRQGII